MAVPMRQPLSEEEIKKVRLLVNEHISGSSSILKPRPRWLQQNYSGKFLLVAFGLMGAGMITREIPCLWLHLIFAGLFTLAIFASFGVLIFEAAYEGFWYLKDRKQRSVERVLKERIGIEVDNDLIACSPIAIEYLAGSCEEEASSIQRRISLLRVNVITNAGIVAFVLAQAKTLKDLWPDMYSAINLPSPAEHADLHSSLLFLLALIFVATMFFFPWFDLRCESTTRQAVYLRRILKLQEAAQKSVVLVGRSDPSPQHEAKPDVRSQPS